MTDDIRAEAIALYDRFTHEGMDRRDFFARMTVLAGSAAAATSLIAAIAASPAKAAVIPPDNPLLTTRMMDWPVAPGRVLKSYTARRRSLAPRPMVLVIHENRGLNEHIRDIARRLALLGFMAVAPDFLSPFGGTPADENKARELIGKLDLLASVADAVAVIEKFKHDVRFTGGNRVGAVGFCWGGAFVNRLAVAAGDTLDAGVSYYGPAPDPSEAAKVVAPLTIHLAGLDTRVAQTAYPWITALRAAGKPVTYFDYEGVNHAFNNDTSEERYNKAAADLAWTRTLRFFRKHLGA